MIYVVLVLILIVAAPLVIFPFRLRMDPIGTGAQIIAGHLKKSFGITGVPKAFLLKMAKRAHFLAEVRGGQLTGTRGYASFLKTHAFLIARLYRDSAISSDQELFLYEMEVSGFDRESRTWSQSA